MNIFPELLWWQATLTILILLAIAVVSMLAFYKIKAKDNLTNFWWDSLKLFLLLLGIICMALSVIVLLGQVS